MRKRFVLLTALLALPALARPAIAAEAKPTLVVRFQSLDGLIADARYLVEAAGREDLGKQLEGLLKSRAGPEGLEGLDTTRPIGLYGQLGPMGVDSKAVLLLPVADEKAVLALLNRLDFGPEKTDGGAYKMTLPNVPLPVFFRFANKYVYATLGDHKAIAKDRLLAPTAVLPADRLGTVSATLNLDQVPDKLKEMALGNLELRLAANKDKVPGETAAQHALRVAIIDEAGAQFKSLLQGGGEVDVRLDVDRKAGNVSLAASLAAKPGSKLETTLTELGAGTSVAAALPTAATAVRVVANVALPESVRKAVGPAFDEGFKRALEKEADADRRKALEGLYKSLGPTIQSGTLDAGFELRGPDGQVYTMVSALRLKDGGQVEKSLRAVAATLPKEVRTFLGLKFDAEKAGAVAVHQLAPAERDAGVKRLLGDAPFYLAFRDDALLLAAGKEGLAALKEAAAAAPKAGTAFRAEVALAQLAPLIAREHKAAPAAAKEAFKEAGSDRVVVTLQGGKALRLRATMKAPVVRFFGLVQKAEKGE